MDFSNLVTREIDERFCYIKYDEFDLIMMKENGFVNATKLCKIGNREFRKWIRLDGSKELIRKVEEMNQISKSAPARSGRGIIIEVNGANQYTKYDIAGSYVHQDLIPHISSWISPLFAVKVSKIINCYVSGKYEFKLKEKENKIDELMELLYKFNDKYDRDTLELKKLYREQRKHAKRMEEKYDLDTRELKEHNKELSNSVKRMEEKYDRDTHELKTELKKIEERLKDKVINPSSPNKLHRLVILQNKRDPNSFKTLRLQAERLDRELDKVKRDYKIFFNAYEPNAVSCFNRLKERLLEQERVKINYNDFILCDL
uniref:KilA N domain protein n=1 Tax=Apapanepox virus TaxID=3049969 RepID=A0AAT9URX7_9POXV